MSEELQWAQTRIERLRTVLATVFLGQDDVLDSMLLGLLSRGNILLEGPPGVGKPLLVKSLSAATDYYHF